jgi:competence protein ComGC
MSRSNREASDELRTKLEQLNLKEVSYSTIGHAAYAWLNETKAGPTFSTPDAASQMIGILAKGQSVGETSQARLEPFFTMLAEQADPIATIEQWSLRNGHEPQAPGIGGGAIERRTDTPRAEFVPEVDEELVKLLAPIQERYEAAKREVDQHQAELTKLKAEANRLLGILKAAGIVPKAQYQKREPKAKKARGSHVSDERAMEILGRIKSYVASNPPALPDVPGSFTRPAIEKAFDLNHSQVAAAVEKLREQGYVRAAGLSTTPSGQKINVFAVIA